MAEANGQQIVSVQEGSIGEELGIEAGDILISIDDERIIDRIDYEMLCASEEIKLIVRDGKSGEEVEMIVEKDVEEGLGLSFETYLMSKERTCANRCKFCFVDQMPEGLRDSLYIKDDDWRMSFLAGNFVTLSNINDNELDRIIRRRVSPLFVSVQASDPKLREYLLGNSKSGKLMQQLKRLAEAGLQFHAQFVLCRGLNDAEELDRSLKDMESLFPAAISAAVVPVGLTRFRKDLASIEPYDEASAVKLLNQIEKWQYYFKSKYDRVFVNASDEFYVLAGRDCPDASQYEGYPQIENGVGMLRKFEDELEIAIAEGLLPKGQSAGKKYLIATGKSAGDWISLQAEKAAKYSGASVDIRMIENKFFGPSVTVAGLLTGSDLLGALKNETKYDAIFIPDTMLKEDEDVFLDDMTLEDLKNSLSIPLHAVSVLGESFLECFCAFKD